jgi:hypothetical protein
MKAKYIMSAIVVTFIMLSAVRGAEYIEVIATTQIRFAPEWRLVQLQDGWAIYSNSDDTGPVRHTPYLIAVKADGIRGKLVEGELLIFQIGLETKLGRLSDMYTKNTRGFDVTVRRYEVLKRTNK